MTEKKVNSTIDINLAILEDNLLFVYSSGTCLRLKDILKRDERIENFKKIVDIIEEQNIDENTIRSILTKITPTSLFKFS